MNTEEWLVFGGLAFTVFGGVFAGLSRFVKIEARVEASEKRAEEERLKNSEQHKEFYDFRRETEPVLAEILSQLSNIVSTQARILDKIDSMDRGEK